MPPPVDPPRRVFNLYQAMLMATSVREMLDTAEELERVVKHWIEDTRASQRRQLEDEARRAREIADILDEVKGSGEHRRTIRERDQRDDDEGKPRGS